MTQIHEAAAAGDVAKVKQCLRRFLFFHPSVDAKNDKGVTALHVPQREVTPKSRMSC